MNTLEIWGSSPDAITVRDGYDATGAPSLLTFDLTEVRDALAVIAARHGDRVRMPSNGSPVIGESDLIVMRDTMQRATP